MPRELFGHHLVDDVAGGVVGIEAGAGDRELVFEKPGDAAAAVEAVRDTLSGPVAGRQKTLERRDRKGAESIVVKRMGSVQCRGRHRAIPAREQRAIDSGGSGT